MKQHNSISNSRVAANTRRSQLSDSALSGLTSAHLRSTVPTYHVRTECIHGTVDAALPLECYRPLEAFRKIPTFHEFAARLKVHGVAFLLIDRA